MFGIAILALGLSAPASAASPYLAHGGPSPQGTSPHALTPRDLAPYSMAIVTVTDLQTGDSTLVKSSQVQNSGPCGTTLGPNDVCLSFSGDGFLGLLDAGPIHGPGDYSVGGSADAHGAQCDGNMVIGVDQFEFSDNSEQAVAVQFDCADSIRGVEISGTIAYNIFPTDPQDGYYIFGQAGELAGFGNDNYLDYLDGAVNVNLNAPIVGMAATPDGGGYWMVGSDGGVFSSGDAQFYGSTGSLHLNKPVVGMAATPDGGGYWFVASDGGIFAYGDAQFYGSTGSMNLNKPIVGMTTTPSGHGYWLVASDGGIFAYGDAQFYGSTGSIRLNKPVVGMAPTPSGNGYWFVASDGGIFAYGDAQFYGSTGSIALNKPIEGMVPTRTGGGYWFVASDGGVFSYGNAPFEGSLGGTGIDDVAGLSLGS
jgi:hypothetical protein